VIRPPLRDLIVPPLDRSRLQAVWQRVEERRTRQTSRWAPRHLVLAGAMGLVVGIVVMRARAPGEAGPLQLVGQGSLDALASDSAPQKVQLSDGSSLLLGRQTRLRLVDNSGRAVGWELARGRVELEVRPGGPRRWTIATDLGRVEVVGTHFVVERTEAGMSVSVSRGEVLVRGAAVPGRARSLVAGESIVVPVVAAVLPTQPPPIAPPTMTPPPIVQPPPIVRPPPIVQPHPSAPSRASTRPAVPAAAAVALPSPLPSPGSSAIASAPPAERAATPRRDYEALLQAADRARRAGQLAAAAPLLEQVAAAEDDRQRAALASFTLGRLYAGALARPADAAKAFDRAVSLGLPQALTEDALLRQAEAYDAAGDRDAARAVATRYLERFPDGRHRQRMQRWLDLPKHTL
jgi:transmembrane sensor